MQELDEQIIDHALWQRAANEAGEDDSQTRERYIQLRAAAIEESVQRDLEVVTARQGHITPKRVDLSELKLTWLERNFSFLHELVVFLFYVSITIGSVYQYGSGDLSFPWLSIKLILFFITLVVLVYPVGDKASQRLGLFAHNKNWLLLSALLLSVFIDPESWWIDAVGIVNPGAYLIIPIMAVLWICFLVKALREIVAAWAVITESYR